LIRSGARPSLAHRLHPEAGRPQGDEDSPLLRITQSADPETNILKLEGSLRSAWLDALREAVAQARPRGRLTLDVTDLRYADASGVELLCAFDADGVMLSGATPYLQALLQISSR
jgi:ABC-type transporter Mla MlaB component